MSISGIQGKLLEVTVVECQKLKDTEWLSRQDPYVCLEYGETKFRTRTCTDGGKHPLFQEKFVFPLIEGLREINVVVWNSNTITYDDFIGSGKVQIQDVLSGGYDDRAWPLQTKTGRYAGEIKLIMHYANANKPATSFAPSAPPYAATPATQAPLYSMPRKYLLPLTHPQQWLTLTQLQHIHLRCLGLPSHLTLWCILHTPTPTPTRTPTLTPHPPPHDPSGYPPPSYPPPLAYPAPPYQPPPNASPSLPPGARPGMYPAPY